jgi:hypothetical protein
MIIFWKSEKSFTTLSHWDCFLKQIELEHKDNNPSVRPELRLGILDWATLPKAQFGH